MDGKRHLNRKREFGSLHVNENIRGRIGHFLRRGVQNGRVVFSFGGSFSFFALKFFLLLMFHLFYLRFV